MKKLDIKGIFTRPRKLLLHPETEWQVIGRRTSRESNFSRISSCLYPCFLLHVRYCYVYCQPHLSTPLEPVSSCSWPPSWGATSLTGCPVNTSQQSGCSQPDGPSPCRVQLGRLHPVPLPFQWILGRIYIPTHGNM